MKYLSLALALSFTVPAFAQKKIEFDENQEKSCHAEAKSLGCIKSDGAADLTCAKKYKSKIKTNCHQILGIQ